MSTALASQYDTSPVFALLRKYGWTDTKTILDMRDGPDRPVWYMNDFKAVVGPIWLTVYDLPRECEIGDMQSYHVSDVEACEKAIKRATKKACGVK